MTHSEYCHNRMARLNASCFITPEIEIYLINNEYLSREEMDEKYPIKGKLFSWWDRKYSKGENPNQSQNFFDL